MKNEIFAFVLMPFNNEFDDIYTYGIKETANDLEIDILALDLPF